MATSRAHDLPPGALLRRLTAGVALGVILGSSRGGAPSFNASAGISPHRPCVGEVFQLTVHVLDWSPGGAGNTPALAPATLTWPDWGALGLAVSVAPTTASRPSSVAGQPALATSLSVGLRASAAGTVTIPAIAVRGATASGATAPLSVAIEPVSSAPPAQASASPAVPAPQAAAGGAPPATSPGPWPGAPSPGSRPDAMASDAAAGRLQMAIGAAAFYAVVIAAVVMGIRQWRARAHRPPE